MPLDQVFPRRDHEELLRHIVDFCQELLRSDSVAINADNVISSADAKAHVAALYRELEGALGAYQARQSFAAAMAVSLLAVLLNERAADVLSTPNPRYRGLLDQLQEALTTTVSPTGGFAEVGDIVAPTSVGQPR